MNSMLDKLFAQYSSAINRSPDIHYVPDNAVKSSKLINPNSDALTVLFPPWHSGGFAYGKI